MIKRIQHIASPGLFIYLSLILLGELISLASFGQQKPQFTQYISNELLINPAYAGADEALNVSLSHRAQWAGIDGAPTTQALMAHSLFKSTKVGVGLAVVNDNIGVHNTLNISPSFSYRIQLKAETFISFGLQVGVNQKTSDYNSLSGQVQNPNDPRLNAGNLSETNFELGSGIYLNSPKFNLGISMPNMIYQSIDTDSINGGLLNNDLYTLFRYIIPVSNSLVLQPGFLMRYNSTFPIYIDFNLSAVINDVLLIGVSYRLNESVNPIVQVKITPQLKFGYAFDYPLGSINSYGNNSHEFMVSYLFSFRKHKVSRLR